MKRNSADPVFADRAGSEIARNPAAVADEVKDTPELEGGALRPGGNPSLFSKNNIGLLAQYAAIGVVYASLYAVIYPAFTVYLHMEGVQTTSISILITLPYTLKCFIGIITDCYPIFGYRRRPYMVIGWSVCFACCLAMACMDIGDPYYPDPSWADLATLTAEQEAQLNTDAPNAGTAYVLLMILANLGSVLAFTASDGILVELSQRETLDVRGSTQTMALVVQYAFQIIAYAVTGFGLNSADYGGTFEGSIGLQGVMAINAGFSLIAIPASWFLITEEKSVAQNIKEYWSRFFELITHRAVYQLIMFRFFHNMFSWITVTAMYIVQSSWAGVEPMTQSVMTILGLIVSSSSLYIMKRVGLNWNWHWVLIVCQVSAVIIDCFPTFFTIWDVFRNQWFWLGVPLISNFPDAIGYIVTTYALLEVIEEGSEAATYGMVTAVSTLASPFATVITKNIDANFDLSYATIQSDTTFAREQVTYAYIIMYCMQIFSLVFLFLLPKQKAQMQELLARGGKSRRVGIAILLVALFLFIWSVMTNLMSIFSETSCLKIAGGTGC
ncbi:Folate-biopterin transporter 1, chloroplastic [Hondaea fermentalgiana]|uniref:Folate-biopterin transporter 1, chloroplastic n=1 Tax=Hondaea fermentalgiana TaxID=2315210 RepID=A0A2R5GBE1_9STRA|nr:Folate-biopterin transporter 1, chloroplastic [Hondaea fermentalgiana]|eukprot:GBG25034.1 Folate-biopterin transporter 1, chloroplastic [Hondaea fermentalgiana]